MKRRGSKFEMETAREYKLDQLVSGFDLMKAGTFNQYSAR